MPSPPTSTADVEALSERALDGSGAPAGQGAPAVRGAKGAEPDQRGRILDVALALLAERGSSGMSMRRLARACDLNVATLYHYFASKDVLVAAAIERGSVEGLVTAPLPVASTGSIEDRLTRLFATLASQMLENDDLWRVLIGEALRGDDDVLATVLSVAETFDEVLGRWLAELLPDAPELASTESVATARHALYGMLILLLVQPGDRSRALAAGVDDLVTVLTGAVTTTARSPGGSPSPGTAHPHTGDIA